MEAGFPFKALRALETASGVPAGEIAGLIGIPVRTPARRKSVGKLLPHESERLLRVAVVFEKAVALFEDNVAAAVKWLTTPKRALEGQTPLTYSRTEPGARQVEGLIGRLEYGVFP